MSIIKSFSVGNGDMFYIHHNNRCFTTIDCNIRAEDEVRILSEIKEKRKDAQVDRFISTSPDLDHIRGIKLFEQKIGIQNFYAVKNDTEKNDDNEDFAMYCDLKDSNKGFYIKQGIKRKWLNEGDTERNGSGIHFYWPDENNDHFKEALKQAAKGVSPNNISPIFRYSLNGGASVLWMGDLGTDFMNLIVEDISLPQTDILIAPHHGRDSGKVPKKFLEQINPKVIIIGEAPADDLNYYLGYDTITQNSAKDITMNLVDSKVLFYSSSDTYKASFLKQERESSTLGYYLGTLYI